MKIAVVAYNFQTGSLGGNAFISKRMAELAKEDDPYGVRVESRDLTDWAYRRAAVAIFGKARGALLASALFRTTHPDRGKKRSLLVDGQASSVQVLSFRHIADREVPEVGERSLERIARALRRRGCDIVHSHFLWYSAVGAEIAARLGVPQVVTAHGSDVHETMRNDEGERKSFVSILEASSSAIFVSRALLAEAKSYGYSGRNAEIIPNGYDPGVFFKSGKRKGRGPGPRLLFVGSVLAVKGADRLPRIFSIIKERFREATLDIVGVDPDRDLEDELRREFALNGTIADVKFHEFLPSSEVAELMRGAELLLIPSRSEGFGCVALEAQACGTPVLGSDAGGLPEAIGIPEQIVGSGGDFEARFAAKAIELLESRERPIREDLSSFTWEATAARERALYRMLLGDRGTSARRG